MNLELTNTVYYLNCRLSKIPTLLGDSLPKIESYLKSKYERKHLYGIEIHTIKCDILGLDIYHEDHYGLFDYRTVINNLLYDSETPSLELKGNILYVNYTFCNVKNGFGYVIDSNHKTKKFMELDSDSFTQNMENTKYKMVEGILEKLKSVC